MAIAGVADGARGPRVVAIDVVRGVAIGAMVVYHAAFDLSAEGLIEADVVEDFGWRLFARSIAGTFLALVGVNLVLATRRGLKPRPFLRRLAIVAGAAALVTLGTFWFMPRAFVFFGILHQITVASVLAIPFLRAPAWLAAAVAAAAIAAPSFAAGPLFDAPALWWVGLSTVPPVSIDYVPIFPWFGVVLAGVVAGRLLVSFAGDSAWSRWRPTNALARFVILAGRWSLPIYLVHQPILIGALYLVAPFLTPGEAAASRNFMGACVPTCRTGERDQPTCTALCGCILERIDGTDLITVRSIELMTPDQQQRWTAITSVCVDAASPD